MKYAIFASFALLTAAVLPAQETPPLMLMAMLLSPEQSPQAAFYLKEPETLP